MPDILIGNLKIDESQVEATLEKLIANMNKVDQASLKALIDNKAAQEAALNAQLAAAQKASAAQEKVITHLKKSYDDIQKKSEEAAKKTTSIFSGLGGSVKKALNFLGVLGGIGTLSSVLRTVGSAVLDVVEKFVKTKEGAKALEGINLQWAKMKAVASDFLTNALEKIIPILNKVLPPLTNGFIKVTAVISGLAAGGKAFVENLGSEFKIFYNNILIAGNSLKAFFTGSEEAKNRVAELKTENIALKNSHIDVFKATKDAYDEQLKSSTAAAANAKVVTELTKEQVAEIKRLKEEYKKLRDELSKKAGEADIAGIVNPFKKVNEQLSVQIKEITDKVNLAKADAKKLNIKFDPQIEVNANKDIDKLQREAKEQIDQVLFGLKKVTLDEISKFDPETPDTPETKFHNDLIRTIKGLGVIPDNIFDDAKKTGLELLQNLSAFFRDPQIITFEDRANLIPADLFKVSDSDKKLLDAQSNQQVVDFKDRLQAQSDAIAKAQKEIDAKNAKDDANDAKTHKNPLSKLLGIDDQELKKVESELKNIFGSLNDIVGAGIQSRLDENQKLLDSIHSRIDTAQAALDKETQLQNEGSANNVATKKKELDELHAQEAAAQAEKIKLQKKALEQQLIIDELSQASSLASAIAPLFADGAKKFGIVGILAAVAAIASMFALYASFKQKAKALSTTTKAHQGGDLARDYGMVAEHNGRSDNYGGRGHRVEDTDLVIGGDEYLNKASVTRKHRRFLDRLNSGEYDGMDLIEVLRRREVRKIESLEDRKVSKTERLENQKVEEVLLKKIFDNKIYVHRTELNELIDEMISRKQQVISNKSESLEVGKTGSLKVNTDHTLQTKNNEVILRRFMMMNENTIISKSLETITGNTFINKNNFATKYIESLKDMRTRKPLFDGEKETRSMRKLIRKDLENKADQGVTRKEMEEVMAKHGKDLAAKFQKTIDEKKEYIPITKDTIAYKVKSKNDSETINLV